MSGERWLRWSRAWFDEATVKHVIEPLVADWQHDAATAGTSRRLQTHLRWQIAVARSFFACVADHVRKPLPVGLGSGAWLMVAGYTGTLLLGTSAGTLAFVSFVVTVNPRVLSLGLPAVLGFAWWSCSW